MLEKAKSLVLGLVATVKDLSKLANPHEQVVEAKSPENYAYERGWDDAVSCDGYFNPTKSPDYDRGYNDGSSNADD